MSKQGTRYNEEFKRTLVNLYHNGKTQASLVKEYPFDNACCESFFKYLKKEETNRRNFRTYQQLYQSVFSYIEGFYNTRRPHGSLGYLTPDEKEALYWNQIK